jgi:hypothetical protein
MQKKKFEGYLGKTPTRVDLNDYEPVAFLNNRDLLKDRILADAFDLTNSIDEHWSENEGVEVMGGRKNYRSTSVGDLIWLNKNDENEGFYIVDNFGFKPVIA